MHFLAFKWWWHRLSNVGVLLDFPYMGWEIKDALVTLLGAAIAIIWQILLPVWWPCFALYLAYKAIRAKFVLNGMARKEQEKRRDHEFWGQFIMDEDDNEERGGHAADNP